MLRILTLNLNAYNIQFGDWESRKQNVVLAIRKSDADILAFQAVRMEMTRFGGFNQAAQISLDLPEYQYALFQPAVINENSSAEGCAVLSRLPIKDAGFKPLTFEPDLEDPNRRVVQYVCFDAENTSLHLFNAHVSWVEQQARSNIDEILQYSDLHQGLRLLVGDFNNTPDSAVIQHVARNGWVDAWQRLYPDKPGYTFDSHDPRLRIDYIWVDQRYADRLEEIQVIHADDTRQDAHLSDHLGLVATINF